MICYKYLDLYYFVSAHFIFLSYPHIEHLWDILPVGLFSLKICMRISVLIWFHKISEFVTLVISPVRSIECCICKRHLMCYILTPMGG